MVSGALREKNMQVPVWGCLKQNMVTRRQRKRGKVAVGPGPGVCKLDTRQATVESCVLDGEGYVH